MIIRSPLSITGRSFSLRSPTRLSKIYKNDVHAQNSIGLHELDEINYITIKIYKVRGYTKKTTFAKMSNNNIKAFFFDNLTKELRVLDQTLLPKTIRYLEVPNSENGYRVIKDMLVRGAPCIAAVGCLSIVAELNKIDLSTFTYTWQITEWLQKKSNLMISARPTAVNLRQALDCLVGQAKNLEHLSLSNFVHKLTEFCLEALESGHTSNKNLGDFGANEILKTNSGSDLVDGVVVLTHCNTGALATVGHGTALGVVRSLRDKGKLERVYCTETRPYNQGSRLTAWELVQEHIPTTLIADNMVAYLMAKQKIDAVLVGADRVAANGDTANKIGTYQIALIAKTFKVPFYVAAPTQSIDLETESEADIEIEQRPANEMRRLGDIQLAPDNVDVWNPCFDVTPSTLITGIITEYGICKPNELEKFLKNVRSDSTSEIVF